MGSPDVGDPQGHGWSSVALGRTGWSPGGRPSGPARWYSTGGWDGTRVTGWTC